jgi:hypothetical protein
MKTISAWITVAFDSGLRRKERVPSLSEPVQKTMKIKTGTNKNDTNNFFDFDPMDIFFKLLQS